MKKQEYDVMEEVYSNKMIPDTSDVNSAKNGAWWKNVHHSSEEESKRPGMYVHMIAFSGTKPLVVKQIQRDKENMYSCDYFTSTYKKR